MLELENKIYKPYFITFEGGENSGKTTQSKMLYEYLISRGIKAIHTREVGGTPEAEKIREILVNSELHPISELLLVMAARYEHVTKIITPALLDNIWVICDRFIDSTICYQSYEDKLDANKIYMLHDYLMGDIYPDLTFFMDVPPEIGLLRTANRENLNKFENRNMEFHEKVYQNFKCMAQRIKNRIVTIECKDLTIEEIHQRILDNFKNF